MNQKTCSVCKVEKDTANFYKSKKTIYQSMCKDCNRSICREWSRDNKRKKKESRVKYKYKTTLTELEQKLVAQGSVCLLCSIKLTIDTLHVDHDHKCCGNSKATCGKCVRGLLCGQCNTSLGHYEYFRDTVGIVSIEKYLK